MASERPRSHIVICFFGRVFSWKFRGISNVFNCADANWPEDASNISVQIATAAARILLSIRGACEGGHNVDG